MTGLRLEMSLLAGLGGGGESGANGSGGGGGGGGGGARNFSGSRRPRQQSFSDYAAELEAALDERAAAAGAVREELARWRQAQQK